MSERCDHCNVGRRGRKKLVVVQHENGERKIVGSTCLHDFLGGKSPQAIAAWAEMLAAFMDEDPERYGERGPALEFRVDPQIYLSWVIRNIRERGWVSRRDARENSQPATAELALNDLTNYARGILKTIIMEADIAEAGDVLVWGQDIELGQNDYLDNLAAVAQKSGWRHQDLGFGASMVNAFRGSKPQRADIAPRRPANSHIGTEGEAEFLEHLLVVSVTEHENKYDPDKPKKLVKMVTGVGGHKVAWWTATDTPPEGMIVEGHATIKKHDSYKGVPETTITYFDWKEA